MKITKCQGEGQGSCKRCTDNGKWNVNWMCFLYKIEGMDGCYCGDCVKEIVGHAKHFPKLSESLNGAMKDPN